MTQPADIEPGPEHPDVAWERDWRHEFLLPLQDMAQALADLEERHEHPELGLGVQLESIAVEMPVELDPWVDEHGQVVLATNTASSDLESGFFPVLHQLRVTIAVEETERGE